MPETSVKDKDTDKDKSPGDEVETTDEPDVKSELSDDIKDSGHALAVLLAMDPEKALDNDISFKIVRLKSTWIARGLTSDEFTKIAKQALIREPDPDNPSRKVTRVDNNVLYALAIFHGIKEPNLKSIELFEHYGIERSKPIDLIRKILLPGEIVLVSGKVNEASGFADTFNQLEEVSENL